MAHTGPVAAHYASAPDNVPVALPGVKATFANLKGGLAKSLSSVYVAIGLARKGRTVLLVDGDATNRTCLKWQALADDWPPTVHVYGWGVPDLARSVRAVQHLFTDVIVDTGPQRPDVIRQALQVAPNMIIPVSPSPVELEQLADTLALAAEIDATSPVYPRVLLVKVRAGTRSSVEARRWLTDRGLPVLTAQVSLRESYALSYGTAGFDLAEYAAVLAELNGDH